MAETGYSRTPKLLKGALIYFGTPMLIPVPNIIIFQYNPESLSRTLTPWQPLKPVVLRHDKRGEPINEDEYQQYLDARATLAQPYDPQESFSLVLEVDATDALEHPDKHPVASLAGVADRLAAIEMLVYPPGNSVLGGITASVSASVSVSAGGVSFEAGLDAQIAFVQRKQAPVVLFFWGPGRIVPVRIMTLTIEEQQFSPTLYPLRAKATIGLRVLSLDDLVTAEGDPATGAAVELAKACYVFTRAQKLALANANLLNTAESLGILPF